VIEAVDDDISDLKQEILNEQSKIEEIIKPFPTQFKEYDETKP